MRTCDVEGEVLLPESDTRRVRQPRPRVHLLCEGRCRHAGVVHPGHRQAHHACRDGLLPHAVLSCGQPEGHGRGGDGDEHGDADDRRAVGHVARDAHRCHAGVMHGGDADAHEWAAHQYVASTSMSPRHPGEGRPGRADRDQEREHRQPHAVDDGHGHLEGQHAHKVHRPDSPAHGERRRGDPPPVCPRGRAANTPSEIQGGVGRQNRDGDGQGDEGRIVARAVHEPTTSFVAVRPRDRLASHHGIEPPPVTCVGYVRA